MRTFLVLLTTAWVAVTAGGCRGGTPPEKIAFVSMRSDPPTIHLVGSKGGDVTRLSSSRAWVAAAPIWSGDGKRVAYTVETGPDAWAIEIYDLAAKKAEIAAKGMKLEDWTGDGAWLIASTVVDTDALLAGKKPRRRSLQQLHAIAADGSGKRVRLSDGSGWDSSPAVSPDGTRIAFVSSRNDKVELRVVAVAGGGAKRVVQVKGDDVLGAPAWSPDGTQIVFECKRGGAKATQRLCATSAAGGETRDLTSSWAASPSFSPDGTHIAYVAKDPEGGEQVWVMGADGSAPRMLTSDGRNTLPRWSLDGTRIAYVSDAPGNPEVVVMTADGGKPVNVSSDTARDGFPSWQPRKAAPKS